MHGYQKARSEVQGVFGRQKGNSIAKKGGLSGTGSTKVHLESSKKHSRRGRDNRAKNVMSKREQP